MTALPAVVQLDFVPQLRLGELIVPLQAIALAVVIALALLVFARGVRRRAPGTRTEDIAFVVLAAIPGAVVGGRLVHGLVYRDAYALDPASLLDLGRGSLSLAGAVMGGALTSAYLCRQLGGRVAAWADAAAVPLLLAIGGGKIAMLLGGMGQGLPWDGRGGVVFLGEGPWGSTDPAVAAYPTQLLEGIWALLGIPVLVLLQRRLARGRGTEEGLVMLAAVGWWSAGRAAVALWWRDQPFLGPWGTEGSIALILLLAVGAAVVFRTRGRRTSDQGPYRDGPATS